MWSTFLVISIAQAVFILIVLLSKNEKSTPLYWLVGIKTLILVANIDFYSIASGMYKYTPHLFGISMGFMFLFGPLLFLYARSISDTAYQSRWHHMAHFIPYGFHLLVNVPFYATNGEIKLGFINQYVQHGIPLRMLDQVMIGLQTAHLFIYLFLTTKSILQVDRQMEVRLKSVFITRTRWVKSLCICFAAYGLCVLLLFLHTLINGVLTTSVNYTYTLVTSAILYFIAYHTILHPEILQFRFLPKSKEARTLEEEQVSQWLATLNRSMEEGKLFRNPELKLELLATELKMQPYQLSRLLNERLCKSFTEYVNEHRIRDFIMKLSDKNFQHYSLYGLATESGFNSKSTFNASFKKQTGKTPTEFRRAILQQDVGAKL